MYSLVLLAAMSGAPEQVEFGGRNKGCMGDNGCKGGGFLGMRDRGNGCNGGNSCNGGGFLGLRDGNGGNGGGFLGHKDKKGCHGGNGNSCHGYSNGCHGYSNGCNGGWGTTASYGHGCTGNWAPAQADCCGGGHVAPVVHYGNGCCGGGYAAPVVGHGYMGGTVVPGTVVPGTVVPHGGEVPMGEDLKKMPEGTEGETPKIGGGEGEG